MTQSKDPYSPMPTSMIGPGGTGDNSLAFQSRVRAGKRNRVPDGTAKATAQIYRPRIMDRIPHLLRGSVPLPGHDDFSIDVLPPVELPGYFRLSLRDEGSEMRSTSGLLSNVPMGQGIAKRLG